MKRRTWITYIRASAILALYIARPVCGAKLDEPPPRFMYVVGCGATVDRLDMVAGRVLESFSLDQKTGKQHLIPDPQGHMDGCLAYGAIYDRAHSIMFTVVPVEAWYGPEGMQHFRVLGFHLPDFQLVEIVQIEPPLQEASPRIFFQHGQLQVTTWDGHLFAVPTGVTRGTAKLVSIQQPGERPDPDFSSLLGNPQAKDLGRFARVNKETGGKQLLTVWLEASGGTNLVQVLHGEDEPLVIAAIHREHAAVLEGLPQTLTQNIHLTPGGQFVYVEESLPPLDGSIFSRKTGRVALFETATGKMVRTWTVSGIQNEAFLAFTPTGKVVYHDGQRYSFEPVAPSFPDSPVEPSDEALRPDWFFANF